MIRFDELQFLHVYLIGVRLLLDENGNYVEEKKKSSCRIQVSKKVRALLYESWKIITSYEI